jgi:hypothetical protein
MSKRHRSVRKHTGWKLCYATLVFQTIERSLRTLLEAIAVNQHRPRDGVNYTSIGCVFFACREECF